MILNDGGNEHRFTLKLSPSTDSFRLENGQFKRSVFIGRRMFNKMFQLIRNEYGTVMGRIQYSDTDMKRGSAFTTEHEQFHFEIHEGKNVEVMINNDEDPTHTLKVTLPNNVENKRERELHLNTLIPSVLAMLIFCKEARLIV